MISGIVPFEEILTSVKDETGIENMRPLYEKVRRLIFRAEREIGYGGTVAVKKRTYKINTSYNGKYFKFPDDFIEFEGVGINSIAVQSNKYTTTPEGIRFNALQTKNVVLVYWGINVDEQGYPLVTRNHEEAVVAYIVWKLYSARIFLGTGNFNAVNAYKEEFINSLLEARGDDAFPTLEEWNDLGALSYTDRRILLEEHTHSYSYAEEECLEDIQEEAIVNPIVIAPVLDKREVYYWQIDSYVDNIESVKSLLTLEYLATKEKKTFALFKEGQSIVYTTIGRAAFAITNTVLGVYQVFDTLGNNITSSFDIFFDSSLGVYLFVTKSFVTNSTLFFKFKNL
jgi:hypothetical protein